MLNEDLTDHNGAPPVSKQGEPLSQSRFHQALIEAYELQARRIAFRSNNGRRELQTIGRSEWVYAQQALRGNAHHV